MSGELETLLRLVSEGRLTAEEAAPIVAALEEAQAAGASGATGSVASASGKSNGRDAARPSGQAADLLADRRLRVYVAEGGRQIINLVIPLAAAGIAIDQVPGLSSENRSRIAEAIQKGLTGPILEVSDAGDEVRIVIE